MNVKRRGFISHIHEEAAVAELIKQRMNQLFPERLELFVSSLDIQAGGWLTQVREAVRSSNYLFPLLSLDSMERPWINFETGCGFMSDPLEIVPICHKDLDVAALRPPFSFFQAYDLRSPLSAAALVSMMAGKLGRDAPLFSPEELCNAIKSADRVLYNFLLTFEALRSADDMREAIGTVDNATRIRIQHRPRLWHQQDLRVRKVNENTLEISGSTLGSTGFTIPNIELPVSSKFLLVRLENSDNSVSHDRNKGFKIEMDRINVKTAVNSHRHYNDPQYTIKGDGWFAFEVPAPVRENGRIGDLNFSLWKVDIQSLLVQLYAA
jgi:hypothetical protein